jgi:hypothetical protein
MFTEKVSKKSPKTSKKPLKNSKNLPIKEIRGRERLTNFWEGL